MPNRAEIGRFKLTLEELTFAGEGLHRPECILCTRSGNMYVSDSRGGVTWIKPDGNQQLIVRGPEDSNPGILVNGIAMERDGSFLLADIAGEGGVWRLTRQGSLTPVVQEADGLSLKVCNYVGIDAQGRKWISISTRQPRRELAYRPGLDDGFIVLLDDKGARVVADGLGFTNEVRPDPTGVYLYAIETFSRRLTRFRLGADGSLSDRETVVSFGAGTFPDGLTFDAEGGIWITGPISNRIIRIDRDGREQLVLEDYDPGFLAGVEQALASGGLGRPQLDRPPPSKVLKGIASLAFGGPDLRTAYVGCLLGDRLAVFRSPVAGVPPVHWDYN